MRIRNNILLVDTETVGDFGTPLVHDIGYRILDKDFNVLFETRHLVKQSRQNFLLNTEFYKNKACKYDNDIEQGLVDILSWQDILKEMKDNMRKYRVKVIGAYNVAFDFRAMNFTTQFLDNGNLQFEKWFKTKKFLCIWNMACETILQTEEFQEWARKNQKVSPKGNIMTSAETCYQFLNKNLGFEEEHTALEDVKIETEILKYIIQNCHHKVKYGLEYGCWKLVQKH